VVRNDIENESHVVRVKLRHETPEIRLAADFRIDPVVVDDVVSVARSRARLHDW
jgi:hypothetical protein